MHSVYEATEAAQSHSSIVFRRSKSAALVLTLVAALGLSACGDKKAEQQRAPQGQQKPPEVGVVTVELQNVPVVSDLPGRLEASRVAQVRARAAGIVQSARSRKART